MRPTVGYIGLGNIGAPMAERIVKAGYELIVWNRTAAKMRALLDAGALAAASPADIAQRADVVFLCVMNADSVETVVFGQDGLTARGGRVSLVIDSSTIHPAGARAIGARLREQFNIGFVDAPVSGGAVGARAGTLAVMAGGAAADVERARPIIMSFANRLTHLGACGAGQAAKACNQIILFATIAAIAESFNAARDFGLEIDRLPEAYSGGFADSNLLREYARSTAAGENEGITFLINGLMETYAGKSQSVFRDSAGNLLKDFNIALQLGIANGSPLPLTSALSSLIRILRTH
ncbi:MAG: NAD(P)-dependent oxidoreductase [Hyphomonadaceae bacterium]